MFAAEPLDLVQIGLRRGDTAALEAALGLALPAPGRASVAGERALLWIQPDAFLLLAPRAAPGATLRSLAPLGGLVDQSDGRSAFKLWGPHARDVLARGCRLDFHPRAFGPGRVASSPLAHVPCVIQQMDDTPCFRLIVFSSFATHVAEWLGHATLAVRQ